MRKINRAGTFAFLFLCSAFLYNPTATAQSQREINPDSIPIDFSCAGYMGGNRSIPQVPAVLRVSPSGGDDTRLLQGALDYIGSLPVQPTGFRGALQLGPGRFLVSGQLRLNKSGVVVRGSTGKSPTLLVATGTDRRSLIQVGSLQDTFSLREALQVTNPSVAAGSRRLTLDKLEDIEPGDHVVITRPSTATWIADLGMNKAEGMFVAYRGLQWPAGSRDLVWDRVVTEADKAKKQILLDAPITTSIQQQYGGATVRVVNGTLPHLIGLENLVLESQYDRANRFDEEHAWTGILVNRAEHVWVRSVTARHFVSAAVSVAPRARCVSVLDCRCEQPTGEAAGYRRYNFLVEGQQVLVQRCVSDSGMNDFATGFCAAGPNVFLDCKALHALGASGSFESWASGVLYENVTVEGAGLQLAYDFSRAQGGGWTAANSIAWNCKASEVIAEGPGEYPNLATSASRSLYQYQLAARKGQAQPETVAAPVVSTANIRAFTYKDLPAPTPLPPPRLHPLQLINGRFVIDGSVVWGGSAGDGFWRGQAFPGGELNSGTSITRYVPGKVGPGLTEDLPVLAKNLARQGTFFYQTVTGLWYDRRRDDHDTRKRTDSQVWAPFYEMPWARSGQGKAWDGMSLYDLTKFNPWYFKRGKEFAQLCDENGLVLYYNLYDTHNLLEYVTHWVDYPWRSVNNLNGTPLPEPLPAEPWARLHLGNQFYNTDQPLMRQLHQAYIFHVLDELGSASNIIFSLGIQFSGPLAFQRFFLQTIADWEQQHNRHVRVALVTSKDITDAILGDPALAQQVDVIDTRYWQYRPEGLFSNRDSLWAPKGGQNRSYREMVGEAFLQETDYPLPTSQPLVYRQVREYTDRFPGKAVVSVYNDVSAIASLMAGGAQVIMSTPRERGGGHLTFNGFVQQYLGSRLMDMRPADNMLVNGQQNWCLADSSRETLLLYSLSGPAIIPDQSGPDRRYKGIWYDPLSEKTISLAEPIRLQKGASIKKPSKNQWLLFLQAF
ncbi:MAG: hypothetical protein INR73_09740 [Williamsia sp.]|nr:hypothetical protein [Williamsia sp.]